MNQNKDALQHRTRGRRTGAVPPGLGIALPLLAAVTFAAAHAEARQDRGWQTIRGTRVFTVVDHNRRIATFSNNCGTQVLTQRQLQLGAIPSNIIPCPRPTQNYRPTPYRPQPTYRPAYRTTMWGALAAGIYRGSPYRVGAGSAVNYTSRAAAEAAALARCHQALPYGGCRVVGTFSGGGCGYVTTGASGPKVGWGAGPTSAAAYRNCLNQGVNCKTPIGGCTTRR